MIKKLMLYAFAISCSIASSAQAIKTPAPSPTQTIKQEFGIGSVELSYSRPNIKGRKVFGDLVPFGQVWRTGANSATTLTFSDEVMIGGTKVPAGKYGLLSIPDKSEWTLILTKQTDVTSPGAYKQESDLVRVKAKPTTLTTPQETFTMQFANVKPASTELQIMWDNQVVSLPINTDVDSKIMTQIDNAINKDNRPYFQSAMYYLDNGKDVNKALAWFDKAVEQQPNAYWIHHQRANALAKLGRKDEAKKTAQKSMDLAKQQNNMDYVRLNEKLIATL
ncbi:MAG TPA: DUF2911 domain-containing protein [Chitinophagaceae bacterium]|jgi:hypothetical protein|nr:DUF2911 domain-containing protein [Chitinophagaceae bacterium]